MAQWWNNGVGVGLVLKDPIEFQSLSIIKTKDDFSDNPKVAKKNGPSSYDLCRWSCWFSELESSIEKA